MKGGRVFTNCVDLSNQVYDDDDDIDIETDEDEH